MNAHSRVAAALAVLVLSLAAASGAAERAPVAPAPHPTRTAPVKPAQQPKMIMLPLVSVDTPKAGEVLGLDGSVVQIVFSAKHLDASKSFSYMPELLRNGAALGPIFNTGFVLNTKKDKEVVGAYRGHYLVGYKETLAPPGGGYQYRITVYEGQWGSGHTVVTSGVSGAFSFSP